MRRAKPIAWSQGPLRRTKPRFTLVRIGVASRGKRAIARERTKSSIKRQGEPHPEGTASGRDSSRNLRNLRAASGVAARPSLTSPFRSFLITLVTHLPL